MEATVNQERKELLREIKNMPSEKLKEILDYVYFIKARDSIDPEQLYFWTRRWQAMEREADADKTRGRIVGTGKVKDLIKFLKK